MPSEIKAISPLLDRLMRLIEGSHCVTGEEAAVELALREFEPSQSPHAEEKSIVGAKPSRVSEAAELFDLLGDGEP